MVIFKKPVNLCHVTWTMIMQAHYYESSGLLAYSLALGFTQSLGYNSQGKHIVQWFKSVQNAEIAGLDLSILETNWFVVTDYHVTFDLKF